jgi:hypothetical protein
MALGMNGKNDPRIIKGTNGRSNFVLDKGDRKTSLKENI